MSQWRASPAAEMSRGVGGFTQSDKDTGVEHPFADRRYLTLIVPCTHEPLLDCS